MKYVGCLLAAERSFLKRSPRKPEPFSTEAIRTLGNRSKRRSTMIEPRKSWITRSNSMCSTPRLNRYSALPGPVWKLWGGAYPGTLKPVFPGVGDHGDA